MSDKNIPRINSSRSRKDTDEELVEKKNTLLSKNITNRIESSLVLKTATDQKLLKLVPPVHKNSTLVRSLDFHNDQKDIVDGQLKILDIMLDLEYQLN